MINYDRGLSTKLIIAWKQYTHVIFIMQSSFNTVSMPKENVQGATVLSHTETTDLLNSKFDKIMLVPRPKTNHALDYLTHGNDMGKKNSSASGMNELKAFIVPFPRKAFLTEQTNIKEKKNFTEFGIEEDPVDPIPSIPALSLVFIGMISIRRMLKKIRVKVLHRHQHGRNDEVMMECKDFSMDDIAYSAAPLHFDYGSIATPWSGDLDKFDV